MIHTPGPWTIGEQNGCLPNEGLVGILRPKQTTKAGVEYQTYVAQYVRTRDASLIASAPDLLKVCKRALTMDCVCPESDDIKNELRAAIAKAEQCERG